MRPTENTAGGARARLRALGPAAQGGILLIAAAAIALLWANSAWSSTYQQIWDVELRVGAGGFTLEKPILLWINDGLMAVFFLLVGLEIKRELLEGTLSSPRKAALPIAAAIGGMLVPVAIYWSINLAGGEPRGWAIPAATDIAFALGILGLLGSRVPVALKVFLTAVAVVDDFGAIAVIALFFTESLSLAALSIAAASVLALALVSRLKVTQPLPYIAIGVVLWLAVLNSGMHATVAGVMLALFIPATKPLAPVRGVARLRELLAGPGDREDSDEIPPDTVIHRVRSLCNDAESPLHRWEHALQPWVLFGIMPLFALANAGVVIAGGGDSSLFSTVSLGVALGLLIGKPLGITLFSWVAVRAGVCDLPAGVTWPRLHAVSWLGGIGFTMSLFIAGLSLDGESLIAAKVSLLIASAMCAIVGTVLLLRSCSLGGAQQRQIGTITNERLAAG